MQTYSQAPSVIQTHDLSVSSGKEISCLRPAQKQEMLKTKAINKRKGKENNLKMRMKKKKSTGK
jgi:hypothetical protein